MQDNAEKDEMKGGLFLWPVHQKRRRMNKGRESREGGRGGRVRGRTPNINVIALLKRIHNAHIYMHSVKYIA